MALSAFWDGLTGTSRAGFLAMVVGAALAFGVYVWFFSYATVTGPMGRYLLNYSDDLEAYATMRSLRLGVDPSHDPLLMILGTSFSASAFGSDEFVSDKLDALTSTHWRVANMATASQSPLDAIALIDHALESNIGEPVVVLLGVDAVTGGWTTEELMQYYDAPRIGVRSPWVDAEVERLGHAPLPRSSIYFLDNWNFSALRAPRLFVRLFLKGPYEDVYFNRSTRQHEEPLPIDARNEPLIAGEIRAVAAEDPQSNLDMYRMLADHLSQLPAARLILMQEVPEAGFLERHDLGGLIAEQTRAYQAFAEEIGASFWAPTAEPSFPREAFYDAYHIGDAPTREALRDDLAAFVAQVYEDMADG
ncbi:MAG: hypothetical protein KDK10_12195 [Maritimibacter sp.]|nr:hypothetical protein [Maritimibacter sp.]